MGGKNPTTTTTQSTAPDPNAYNAYLNVLNQAQSIGNSTYQPYTGQLTAPVNQQQTTGIQGVNNYANAAQPAYQAALGQAQSSSTPLTAAQIQQYESPYTQQVVNATQNQFNQQNAQAQQGILGNAIAQGALGGNRSVIGQAELAGQQQTAQAPVIAGLENTGYNQAVSTAENQQQLGLQGASLTGQLGAGAQSAGLQGAGQQIAAGTLQQTTQQAQDQALYQQYQNQQAYPYQQLSWLAGIDTGVGSNMGGTGSGTTVGPSPNVFGQIIGAGAAAAGLYNMSDRRVKENIQSIGKLHNGMTIYRFNFKGDPKTQIGLMAQDVRKDHPEAVKSINGILHVDHKRATDDSVRRALGGVVPHFDSGGGVAPIPYGGMANSIFPNQSIVHGSGPPHVSPPGQPSQQQSQNQEAQNLGSLAKSIMGAVNTSGNPAGTATGGVGVDLNATGSFYARGGGIRGYEDGGVIPMPRPDPREGGADVRAAYDDIRGNPPVTVMEDFMGNLSPSKAQNNAFRDAVRQRAADTIKRYPDVSDPVAAYINGRAGGGGVRGYDDGGGVAPASSFDDRWNGLYGDQAPTDDPAAAPYYIDADASQRWRDGVDKDLNRGQTMQALNAPAPIPPEVAPTAVAARGVVPSSSQALAFSNDAGSNTTALPDIIAYGKDSNSPPEAAGLVPTSLAPPTSGLDTSSMSSRFGPDSKLWPALVSAGFGMMASRSPYLGNMIGEGGQAAIGSYNKQSEQERAEKLEQQKMAFEREKFNRPYNELTADQNAILARQKAQDAITQANQPIIIDPKTGQPMRNPISAQIKEEDKIPFGWEQKDDGTIAPVKGGPQDTAYQRDVAAAKRLPGMSDDALADMAKAYRQGFTGVIQQIARGTSGPDNLNRFWNIMEQQLKEEGLTGRDLASAKANFQAQSAAAVTAARREANVESNVVEAQKTFPLALEASANLPRSSWTDWNKLKQMYNEHTSSPEQARFFTATQGVITTYAQAMARAGVATVDGRHAAEALLSTVTGPEAYGAVIRQMEKEMQAAVEAPDVVRQHILDRISGRPSAAPAASAPALPPAAAALPAGIPPGSQYSPSRKQYRDPQGRLYDANGRPL